MLRLVMTIASVVVLVGGCASGQRPAATSIQRAGGHTLAVQPEPLPPGVEKTLAMPAGKLVLSPRGCLALGDPGTVIYAPYGSTITADGEGFTFQGHTLRLGDDQDYYSGAVWEVAEIDHPSPALKACAPKHVAILQGPG